MKTYSQKKHLFTVLLLLSLFSSVTYAQIINIPDANFKAKLLSANTSNGVARDINNIPILLNINGDGEIQVSEALLVYRMFLVSSNITNLTGINSFTNIIALRCNGNLLTSLDVSSLLNIEELYCEQNQISSLNSSLLSPSLTYLDCSDNLIVNLNLSSSLNPNLSILVCNKNQITNLNLSGMINITRLDISTNPIINLNINDIVNLSFLAFELPAGSNLDLTTFPNLTELWYVESDQSSVSVSNLPNLQYLRIQGLSITNITIININSLVTLELLSTSLIDLNVSNIFSLNRLYTAFNDDLKTINMKNGNVFSSVFINEVNQVYVCSNENDKVIVEDELTTQGQGGYTNSYCTFVPGGNYNTITGTTIYDANDNGCDLTDAPFPFVKINYTDGTNNYSTFTEDNGIYNLYTTTGNYTITTGLENPSFYNVSPPSATINFANNTNNVTNQEFCISKNGIHPDVEVVVAPIIVSTPNSIAKYQIVYKNKGTETLSGTINFTYDDVLLDLDVTSIAPTSQVLNILTWNYLDLKPFENRSIEVTFDVLGLLSEEIELKANINNNNTDETPIDNFFIYKEKVVTALDPISITCLQGENADNSLIGDYLHYIVNFENSNADPITNIVIKTEIDPTQFDINSLQVLNASNQAIVSNPIDVYPRIKNNTVELICKNVNLGGPGGHGNILLKIRTLGVLTEGATVLSNATIYYDYEAPSATNDAVTTFANLKASVFEEDTEILVYPNPAKSFIKIESQNKLGEIQVYDVQGRLIQTVLGSNDTLEISELATGTYFLKLKTSLGSKVVQIIKE